MRLALPAGHRLAGRAELALADVADEAWVASSRRIEETLRGHLPRPSSMCSRRPPPGGEPSRARDRGGTRSGTRRFCPSSGSLVMPPKASPCLSCRRFNRHVVSFCH
ncbi:hypothetical protein [Streptomyces sp. IBSBF 2435]|uniref:hypothetical protein n=1 Tax=Streptomyces sp. IBSBF 2435 TaxID=2903531 RepID=UPI002FDC2CCB